MVKIMKLGKLEKVKDLSSVWKHEANNFTKWLSEEENLKTLSEEIGIDIELITTEAKTGSFSTEILAVESNTENKIVIGTQLETTNHEYLGKIITYASGHDAKTIIWIVKEACEEHRQAVDWLNEHTDDEINIFLCRIELWKIGESAIAPKFQIVSSPNNWTKTIKRSLDNKFSSSKMLQYDYWTRVKEEIDENYSKFNSKKPRGSHHYDLSLGTSLATIGLHVITKSNEIRVLLWIPDSKELFNYLYESKDEIESELGYEVEWNNSEINKSSNIVISKYADINNQSNWDENIKWHLTKASEFYDVFSDRIKKFK